MPEDDRALSLSPAVEEWTPWATVVRGVQARLLNSTVAGSLTYDELSLLFTPLAQNRDLTLDERWHGDDTIADVTMRALPLASEEVTQSPLSLPRYNTLFLVASLALNLGRSKESLSYPPISGSRRELPHRSPSGRFDAFRRVQYSGHAQASAALFTEILSAVNPPACDEYHLSHGEITMAAAWIKYSAAATTFARGAKGQDERQWAERLAKRACSNFLISEQLPVSDILNGIAMLARVRHSLCNPSEATKRFANPSNSSLQELWKLQHQAVLAATTALQSTSPTISQWVTARRALPLLGAVDWERLHIPITDRRAAQSMLSELPTSYGRRNAITLLNGTFGSTLLNENEILELANTPYGIEERFSRFLALTSTGVHKDPLGRYSITHFSANPLRQFDTSSADTEVRRHLKEFNYPHIEALCVSLREQGLADPVQQVVNLVTVGAFPSLPELELYLSRHSTNPLDISSGYVSQARAAEVHRRDPLANGSTVITLLHGYQSRFEHKGAGLAHITYQRRSEIAHYFSIPSSSNESPTKRFRDDGILFVAGCAVLEIPSARNFHSHTLLTGVVRDSSNYLTLVLHHLSMGSHPKTIITTAIFHRDVARARQYLEKEVAKLEACGDASPEQLLALNARISASFPA
jgi:hypothetical protein